jgi:hypothetical protein
MKRVHDSFRAPRVERHGKRRRQCTVSLIQDGTVRWVESVSSKRFSRLSRVPFRAWPYRAGELKPPPVVRLRSSGTNNPVVYKFGIALARPQSRGLVDQAVVEIIERLCP